MIFSGGMAFVPGDSMFQLHEDNHLPTTSLYAPQDFQGVPSVMMRRSLSFSGMDDDMSDDGCALGEKKRRLNMEQVRALEKSFELGNKLEPERKVQLARALGLQPRQVAIWFQNRRARWKTKQLERDYDVLKKQFDTLKAHNHSLKTHNQKLQSEILALKNKESSGVIGAINLNKENTEGSWSNNGSENSLTQVLLQSSSTILDLQSPKIDQSVQDEGFCNIFNEEQPNFWPWSEQQHFQ